MGINLGVGGGGGGENTRGLHRIFILGRGTFVRSLKD